jgi:putative glycerol-1-phosphate prenyltransferase
VTRRVRARSVARAGGAGGASRARPRLALPRGPLALLARTARGPRLAALIDPDRVSPTEARALAQRLAAAGFDLLFLGTSVSRLGREGAVARAIHRATPLPVVLFPGSADHLTEHADALLFLTLLSGRNADYLVGEQVRAARRVRALGLPAIPTAYLLIDGGRVSTVEQVTGTKPIAGDDVAGLVDHALAAGFLGQRAVYLEAGSGALRPVAARSVRAVRAATDLAIIVGGGIRTPEQCRALARAGADTIVIGTLIEEGAVERDLRDLVAGARARAGA